VRRRSVIYHPETPKKSPIIGANDRMYHPDDIRSEIVKIGGANFKTSTSFTSMCRGCISKSIFSRASSYARLPSIWRALYFGGTCSVCAKRKSLSSSDVLV